MNKFKVALALLLINCLFISVLTGCTTVSSGKSSLMSEPASLLEPQTISKFADVPVPVGFKFLPQDSYAFESADVRVGVLKYQGKADVERVVNFYKEQMAMYNWNLLNVTEYGQRLLNFDRENETCIISLLPKGSSITIIVSMGPKAQILPKTKKSAEKEKPLK